MQHLVIILGDVSPYTVPDIAFPRGWRIVYAWTELTKLAGLSFKLRLHGANWPGYPSQVLIKLMIWTQWAQKQLKSQFGSNCMSLF